MPPKKKGSSKVKTHPKPPVYAPIGDLSVDDLPADNLLLVDDSPTKDLTAPATPHFTERRHKVDDEDEIQDKEKNEILIDTVKNMNATVVIEQLSSEFITNQIMIESVENEEVPNTMIVEKKGKGKPKLKKPTNKRATSEENNVTKEKTVVVSKSRKRPIDKDALSSKPSTSPTDEPPKRNRRAASVDTLSSKVSKTEKDTVDSVEKVSKKNKKEVKKDQQNVQNKITKPKKTTKKVLDKEKEKSTIQQNIDKLNNIPGKPKLKRGAKKDEVETHKEVEVVKIKPIKVDRGRGTASKIKQANDQYKKLKHNPKFTQANNSPEQSEELSDDKIETDDFDSVPKTLELKPKRANKGKQIIIESYENSEESSSDDKVSDEYVLPEVKQKRVRKGTQTNVKQHKESEEKGSKIPKSRGGRKVKGENFEDVSLESPSANCIEVVKTGNSIDDVPNSPESGKNENKPAVVKRKAKAKTVKK